MKAAVALLALTALVACQKEGISAATADASQAAVARVATLGPLRISVPEGFVVVHSAPSGVDLRHVTGLSASLGAVPRTSTAQEEQTILKFLLEAEDDLKTIPEALVTRVGRTLPGIKLPLRGLVAFSPNPDVPSGPREKRVFWVLTEASTVVTASFIHLENSAVADASIDAVLVALGDALKASEAKP